MMEPRLRYFYAQKSALLRSLQMSMLEVASVAQDLVDHEATAADPSDDAAALAAQVQQLMAAAAGLRSAVEAMLPD